MAAIAKLLKSSALITVLVGACTLKSALADVGHPSVAAVFAKRAAKAEVTLMEIRAELEATSKEQWSEAQVAIYLENALDSVYSATAAYMFSKDQLPDELPSLVGAGFLRAWPANPLTDWQPLDVIQSGNAAEFAPGALYWRCAPHAFFSEGGAAGEIRALSFELGIFAPSPEYVQISNGITPQAGNADWARLPAGLLGNLGVHTEPAAVTQAERDAFHQLLKSIETEAAQ